MLNNIVTKRSGCVVILFFVIIATVALYLSSAFPELCIASDSNSNSIKYCENIFTILLPFYAALILSGITFSLSTTVFQTWMKFTLAWIPLSMILIVLMPENYSGFFGYDKLTAAIPLTVIYFAISLVTILVKSIQVYRKK